MMNNIKQYYNTNMAPSSETKLQVSLRRFDNALNSIMTASTYPINKSLYQPILDLLHNGYDINSIDFIDGNDETLLITIVSIYYTHDIEDVLKIVTLLISRGINIYYASRYSGTALDVLEQQLDDSPEDSHDINKIITLIRSYT